MSWWAIEVGPGSADRDLVGHALATLTGHAVEERPGGTLVGYLADEGSGGRIAAGLRERFGEVAVLVRAVEVVDWTERWKEGLEIRRVGGLEIGPSWLLEPGPGRVVIDPEMAFGTGEHGSTRGALILLARHLTPGVSVLDLGCGSGILAIAAVKLGARHAIGIEIDAEAIPVAEANLRRNQAAGAVRILAGDAAPLAPLAGPAGLVVSNILRHANVALLEPIRRSLEPGGVAVFAGMEVEEAALFRAPLAGAGFEVVDETIDTGWWSVAARVR